MDYLTEISTQLGISLWLLLIILIWSMVWKLLALWKSSRKNQPVWFVLLFVVNTIGILEILYIYVFSEMNLDKKLKEEQKSKPIKKKRK